MNPNLRNFALWAIIALLLIALFNMFQSPTDRNTGREIAYSKFLSDVDAGRVRDVTIVGERITGTYNDTGGNFQTYSPGDTNLVSELTKKNVNITARPESASASPARTTTPAETSRPIRRAIPIWFRSSPRRMSTSPRVRKSIRRIRSSVI